MLIGACAFAVSGCLLVLAYWYLPRWVSREGERLSSEEAAGIPPSPRDYHYAIDSDSRGFTVVDLRNPDCEPISMSWSEVTRVPVFRQDLVTVDCIRLFFSRSNSTGVVVDEEMGRWRSFIEALPQHLPGCMPGSDWLLAGDPLESAATPTRIYDRVAPEIEETEKS